VLPTTMSASAVDK